MPCCDGRLYDGKFDETTEKTCRDYGAAKIIEIEQEAYNIQSYGEILVQLTEKYVPMAILSGATPEGKEIMAYASSSSCPNTALTPIRSKAVNKTENFLIN